jgi:hypothetical protein
VPHPLCTPLPAAPRYGRCLFNATHGWDLWGIAPVATTGHTSSFLQGRKPWDFGGAGTEQGFIFYMCFVRHRVGAYGSRDRATLPLSRHWWGPATKPWGYEPRAIASMPVDFALAMVYDYVMRESSEVERNGTGWGGGGGDGGGGGSRGGGGGGGGGGGRTPLTLVAKQRAVRRAVEAHPYFDELFHIWQHWAWNPRGDGLVFMVPLPAHVQDIRRRSPLSLPLATHRRSNA